MINRRISLSILSLVAAMTSGCSSDAGSAATVPVLVEGAPLPPATPFRLEVGTHCGVAELGPLVNGIRWRTDEVAAGTGLDWIPPEWSAELGPGDQLLTVEVVLSADQTRLTASTHGRAVEYRPSRADEPAVLCA